MNMTKRAKAHQDIDTIFLQRLPQQGLTIREEQVRLCHAMLDSMMREGIALYDAGVGLGKTYAYLAAGILFREYAAGQDAPPKPLLVSTASIALQDAILTEYIPFLSNVLLNADMIDKPLLAVLRKGKAHYVCDDRLQKRLDKANMAKKNDKAAAALRSLEMFIDMDGITHLSDYDRRLVCVPDRCDCYFPDCRYREFVRSSRSSEYVIQVCNHNFYIADAIHRKTGIPALLPDYCAAVVDEAHKLPEAARQMFGKSLSVTDMLALTDGLKAEKYILAAEKLYGALKPIIHDLQRLDDGEYVIDRIRKAQFAAAVKAVQSVRGKIGNTVRLSTQGQLTDALDVLDLFKRNDKGFILYADRDEDNQPTLTAANPNYAMRMKDVLWSRNVPAILTSGTLAVGDDFSRFKDQAGLKTMKTRTTESVTPSPFDYKRNCLLYFPKYMRHKPEDETRYINELAKEVSRLIAATHGHTLVLFNAYSVMAMVCEQMKRSNTIFPLFVLKKNQPQALTDFRASGNGVLFATGAAWEGVDFPGDIVSSLIITRLPFAIPNALSDFEKRKHLSLQMFLNKVIVPDMQIKLRQGFGRAIRTETDTCVISVLDERSLIGRRYHAAVLAALPEMDITDNFQDVGAFIQMAKPKEYFTEGTVYEK